MEIKKGYMYLTDLEKQVLREAKDFNPSYIRQGIHNWKLFISVKKYFDEIGLDYIVRQENGRVLVNVIFAFYMKCRLVENLDCYNIDTMLQIIKDGLGLQDVEKYRDILNGYMQGGLYCFEAMTAFLVVYQRCKKNGKEMVYDSETIAKDVANIIRHIKHKDTLQRKKRSFGNADAFLFYGDKIKLGE